MKIVDKKLLDELIRLTKKYWNTGGADLVGAKIEVAKNLSEQIFNHKNSWCKLSDIISSIVSPHGLKPDATNEDIYRVFTVLGYEVAENTEGEE